MYSAEIERKLAINIILKNYVNLTFSEREILWYSTYKNILLKIDKYIIVKYKKIEELEDEVMKLRY